jgi:glycosyltransferase involved in cell wall biosynthesis
VLAILQPTSNIVQATTETRQPRTAPLVSVIIPSYNTARQISACLDSVFAQTFRDLEVIVVNDGSPDTPQLETAMQPYIDRIVYIRQENRGPSGARNTAIRAAQGKYVALLDSDDIFAPDHLENMVPVIEERGLDLLYCDSFEVQYGVPKGPMFDRYPQVGPVTFEKLLREDCCVLTSTVVALRQTLIDAGLFDEHYRCCEDFELWLRMSSRGAKIDFIERVGVERRELPTGFSADLELMLDARLEVYRKTSTSLPLSKAQQEIITKMTIRHKASWQTELAKRYLRQRRYAEARIAAAKAAELLQNRKSQKVALAVRIAPWAVRGFLRIQEARLAQRTKWANPRREDPDTIGTKENIRVQELSKDTHDDVRC